MAQEFDFSKTILAQTAKLNVLLEKPEGLMKQIGALGADTARRSFQDQALGDWSWPPRYPNQGEPFINIAGAVQDFTDGRNFPKPNRFQRRPANVDEGKRGGLWGSISNNAPSVFIAQWGTNKDYSAILQGGGVSVQKITPTTRSNYAEAVKKARKKVKSFKGRDVVVSERTTKKTKGLTKTERTTFKSKFLQDAEDQKNALQKMAFIFHADELQTQVNQRPFLGVTDQFEADAIRTVQKYFFNRQSQSARSEFFKDKF